ncbi:hypothetical protein [Nonomuraea sp. CA-141351]|uniref:hypothetical protein n=1 Tax=Nonomuraea sp. CA-141351 TaxID=3239996 RepID=UPI003D94550D
MGRHGTGGSDDGDERGNNSAFWGPDEQAEPPGWPSLPDEPEVTGQWAPMPRRTDGPPSRGPQSEPFETTGAFALPNDPAGGFPPANDPSRAFPPARPGEEAGPFETTGAFTRPSEWGPVADRSFDGPDPADRPFAGPADQTSVFGGPDRMPGRGAPDPGPSGIFGGAPNDRPGPSAGRGPFDVPGPFDGPMERTAFFDGPDAPGPSERTAFFDGPDAQGPSERTAFFDGRDAHGASERTPFFDGPDAPGPSERTAFFDGPNAPGGAFGGPPGDRTGGFDVPLSPGPPEPGDVKVAGEPTAVQAPAWANAETGFLGSDWPSDSGYDEPEEPKGRRGRRKPGRGGDDVLAAPPSGGGKGRVALLSVAAVAVVLGGTVAGVKFMSSSSGTGKCADTTCAAVQATGNQPGPEVSQPSEEQTQPEEEPTEEPTEKDTPSTAPSPTASYSARTPRRTSSATPTPTKTKVKTSSKPTEDPTPPVEESVSESPAEEPSTLDDSDTGGAPTSGTTPAPTDTGTFGSGAGSMNLRQTIKQQLFTYQAAMTLSNTSKQTLENPTVSVPVEGKVMNVTGAQWTQDGDLLILDLSASLASGDSVSVSFTATGKGEKAANCGLVSGKCAVS